MRRGRVISAAHLLVGDLVDITGGVPEVVRRVWRDGKLVMVETENFVQVGIKADRVVFVVRADR